MRIAWLFVVLVSGCVVNPPSAQVEASWTIQQLDGSIVGCKQWQAAVLKTDGAGVRTADHFACDDGVGMTARLPEGVRTAWLEFVDGDGAITATSLAQTIEVHMGLVTSMEATIYLDAGYVAASWSWEDARWCDSSTFNPFQAIYLTLTPNVGTHVFSCHDDRGVTSPIAVGRYAVSIGQGFDSQDLPDIVVTGPNGMTMLPPVVL